MNPTRLTNCILGAATTWGLTFLVWFQTHMNLIVGLFAIAASIFTSLAAWEKWKWLRAQRRKIEGDGK